MQMMRPQFDFLPVTKGSIKPGQVIVDMESFKSSRNDFTRAHSTYYPIIIYMVSSFILNDHPKYPFCRRETMKIRTIQL